MPEKTTINDMARTFSLFQDPLRMRLFLMLVERARTRKSLCVSELADKLGSSLSNTSHQLRKMELAGIVEPARQGRMICYQFRRTPFNMKVYSFLRSIIEK